MRHLITTLAAFLFVATIAVADEAATYPEFVTNKDGFAQIGFSRVVDGTVYPYDLVDAYDRHMTVPADCRKHHVVFRNVTWCFSSESNQAKFLAAIDGEDNRYLPAFGGRCAWGLVYGNLGAVGDPLTAVRIGDRTVLNGSFEARGAFLENTDRHMGFAGLEMRHGLRDGRIVPNN